MTLEEKIAALEAYEYEDYSSELERYKNAVSKANSEAAECGRKNITHFFRRKSEKKNEAEEEMNKIREGFLKLSARKNLKANIEAKLIALGYDETLAAETAKALVNGETEKVFAAQKNIKVS